jgi:acyl carrier protein
MPQVKRDDPACATRGLVKSAVERSQIREFLAREIHVTCGIPLMSIEDSSTIDKDLTLESIQLVALQVAVEQEFDIAVDFLEVLRLNSFGQIVSYIHSLASTRPGMTTTLNDRCSSDL